MGDPKKQTVLIVCTGNSCRSQMAEALWRHESGGEYEVASAGTHPTGVHPLARRVIEELGIDMSGQFSKSVYALTNRTFDLVVTVCDSAQELCPTVPTATERLHWPLYDPVVVTGTEDQRLASFQRVRDEIRGMIQKYLAHESAIDAKK
jgi:arsenate reductase